MACQASLLLLHAWPGRPFLAFLLFSTICSYSFHWYLTPAYAGTSSRSAWLQRHRPVHLVLLVAGLLGTAVSFGWLTHHWSWLAGGALVTFLYSAPKIPHPFFRALRKVAIGKTIFLAFMWMYATTLLPLLLSGAAWQWSFTLFAAGRFFLIYAICILFDFRDREYDKSTGIRSLVTLLPEKQIDRIFVLSLAAFAVSTLLLGREGVSFSHVALLLIPGLLTAGLYKYAREHFSDILYYFVLDGLMALSAFLFLLNNWLCNCL